MALVFTVYGVGRPKGNMKTFFKKGMKRPIITDSGQSAKSWSQLVAEGANRAIAELPASERGLLTEAVRLTVAFYLPRPKKYSKRGVPVAHLTKPDIDKLLRGVLDALSLVVFKDDSQVVELLAMKHYADVDAMPHADIRVERTGGAKPVSVPAAPLPLFGAM